MAEKRSNSSVSINKRGGYSGGKPGSEMRPPVRTPSATNGRPTGATTANSGTAKK